jgi:pimeloyl-ACP methyl ester carboxylesterase
VVVDFMRKSLKMVKLFPIVSPIIQFLSHSALLRKKLFASEMMHADRMPYEVVKDRFSRIGQMTIFEEFLSADLQALQPMPADFKVPLRVVWCEEDTTLRFEDCGQPLLDVLGLKTHGVLKDCGHNPMYDDPEGVVKAIMDFTREVDAKKDK